MTRSQKPGPGQGRAGQDSLLAEARRASHEAAEAAAAQDVPPLDWEALKRRRAARNRAAAWAAVLIPLLLVGGSAGTWALVHHLKIAQPEVEPPVARRPARAPVVERPVTQPRRGGRAIPTPEPASPKPAVRPRKATRPRADAAPATASVDAGQPPRQIVVLPGRVTGDDEVIIVTPKAKMKPLWTVEGFKRRGMKGFLKKVDPVKPAPEGVEHEIP